MGVIYMLAKVHFGDISFDDQIHKEKLFQNIWWQKTCLEKIIEEEEEEEEEN